MTQTEIQRHETIARYCAAPDRLEAALADLAESDFDLARGRGAWTIRQIVHHIVDSDDLAKTMITVAVGNSGCTYDQRWYDTRNAFAETLEYATRAVAPAIALFCANHRHTEELLRQIPDAWDRFVILQWEKEPEGRNVTVEYLINGQTWHALHHIEQIRATRDAHGL